ncbi:MAG: hypothetical protein GY754_06100 [bacterium]|nr:hypothetical protein [bacterium]
METVERTIIKKGPVFFSSYEPGSAITKAAALEPGDLIAETEKAGLRERRGAQISVARKWEQVRAVKEETGEETACIVCNADEGDPGVLKDRVLLAENPRLLFEGMALAGYAAGAEEGVFFLRKEYGDLKENLEKVLGTMRENNFLGTAIAGKKGFNFDINIRTGAGAYIAGEESPLTGVEEGKRAETGEQPAFTAQKGYQGSPAAVNTVETFCSMARIIEKGSAWFASLGTGLSKGTRILSISGDCEKPGMYEVEWGLSLSDIITMAQGINTGAIVSGGPAGIYINEKDFSRKLCHDDLSTGGSILLVQKEKDLFDNILSSARFFAEESCGWCVPCRAGTVLLKQKLEKISHGSGIAQDLKELEEWCGIIRAASRCGHGQSAPNPIMSSIKNFKEVYEAKLRKGVDYASDFDLDKALEQARELRRR